MQFLPNQGFLKLEIWKGLTRNVGNEPLKYHKAPTDFPIDFSQQLNVGYRLNRESIIPISISNSINKNIWEHFFQERSSSNPSIWDTNLSMLVYDIEVFAWIRQRQDPQELSAQAGCQDSYFPAPTTTELGHGGFIEPPLCSSCHRLGCNIPFQTVKQHFGDCNRSFRIQASLIRPAAPSVIGSYEFIFLLCRKCTTLTQEYGSTFAPPDKYINLVKGAVCIHLFQLWAVSAD